MWAVQITVSNVVILQHVANATLHFTCISLSVSVLVLTLILSLGINAKVIFFLYIKYLNEFYLKVAQKAVLLAPH